LLAGFPDQHDNIDERANIAITTIADMVARTKNLRVLDSEKTIICGRVADKLEFCTLYDLGMPVMSRMPDAMTKAHRALDFQFNHFAAWLTVNSFTYHCGTAIADADSYAATINYIAACVPAFGVGQLAFRWPGDSVMERIIKSVLPATRLDTDAVVRVLTGHDFIERLMHHASLEAAA